MRGGRLRWVAAAVMLVGSAFVFHAGCNAAPTNGPATGSSEVESQVSGELAAGTSEDSRQETAPGKALGPFEQMERMPSIDAWHAAYVTTARYILATFFPTVRIGSNATPLWLQDSPASLDTPGLTPGQHDYLYAMEPEFMEKCAEAGLQAETRTDRDGGENVIRIVFRAVTPLRADVAGARVCFRGPERPWQELLLLLQEEEGAWSVLAAHAPEATLAPAERVDVQLRAFQAYLSEYGPYESLPVLYFSLSEPGAPDRPDGDPPAEWLLAMADEFHVRARPGSMFPSPEALVGGPDTPPTQPDGIRLSVGTPVVFDAEHVATQFIWYRGPLYAYGFWYYFERVGGEWVLTSVSFAWVS